MAEVGSIYVRIGAQIDDFEAAMRKIEGSIKQAESRFEGMRAVGERLSSVGQKVALAGGAMATGFGFAVKTAADFEAQMSKVQALSGATEADFKRLRDAAIELGAKSVYSASEAAEGMQILAAAGFDANQIIDAMPGLLNAAAAAGENFGTVADIMVAAMSGFGLQAQDMAHIADVLASAANASAISITDIGYSLKYVAPVAKTAGVSLEEVSAALAILGNAGIKADQAGTTLRMALIRLADPPKEAAEMLKQLGVQITDANGKMLPFQQIIAQLHEKFSGLSQAQQIQAASTIFGAEAMSGMLTLIEAGPEKLGALTTEFQNSSGAAQQMADTMTNNLAGAWEEFKGALESAFIAIGTALTPAIQNIVQHLQKLVEWFNSLPEPVKENIAKFAALAAGLTVVGGGMLMFAGMVMQGVAGIATLAAKLGALPAVFTGLAGPVGIAVAAIAGLGIGVAALVNHFKQSSIEVDLFGDKVSEATQEAVGAFLDLNDQATVALNQLSWSGQTVTQEMANNITSIFDQMGDQVLAAMQQDHQAQLTQMQNFFAQSSALTEQEEQEALAKLQQHQQQEQQTIQQGQQRIAEILNTAKEQKRAITDAERQEINQIQQQMVETGIQYLSQNELEAKSILERMKAQAGELTAQQAAEVVRNSKKQKDEAIKAAEEQYNNVVKEIIRQRDEVGSITKEQADKLIQEATRQRDEAVKKATDMHNKVVEEAKKQAGEHVNQVDWETGQVLSKWEAFKNNMQSKWETIKTNTKSKLIEMSNNVRNKYEEMKNTASDKFESMKDTISEKMTTAKTKIEEIWNQAQSFLEDIDLFEIGKDIIKGFIDGISSIAHSVYKKAEEIADRVKDTIKSALRISSPSRVMMELGEFTAEGFAVGLNQAIAAVRQQALALADIAIPAVPSVATLSVSSLSIQGLSTPEPSMNLAGAGAGGGDIIIQNMYVRNDTDIELIARRLWQLQQSRSRGRGR